MRVIERQPELVQPVLREIKVLEERFREPAAAVVGAEFVIFHHHHPAIGKLDPLFAGSGQNAEIGNSGLRPILEAGSDGALVTFIHGVELSALCRSARAYEPVMHAIHFEVAHGLFHQGFLEGFQAAGRNVEPGDTDARIESLEECILQLLFAFEFGEFPCQLAHLINVECDDRHHAVWNGCHLILLDLSGKDRQGGRSCRSLCCPCRKRGKGFRPGCKEPGQRGLV